MKKNKKLLLLSEILFSMKHDMFDLSRKETYVFYPASLWYSIHSKRVEYGISSTIYNVYQVTFPQYIMIGCSADLDAIDKLLLRFISNYSIIVYLDKYPELPAPKLYLKELKHPIIPDLIDLGRAILKRKKKHYDDTYPIYEGRLLH